MFLDAVFEVLLGAADVDLPSLFARHFVDDYFVSAFFTECADFVVFPDTLAVAGFVSEVERFGRFVKFGNECQDLDYSLAR